MKAKKLTRLLSMIMSVLMLMGNIPGTGLAAMAADDDDATTGNTTLADELITQMGLSDIPADEAEDDTDSTAYKVWVGETRVTDDNKNDILGDGTASFDPASNTLTLNNAVINKFSTEKDGVSSEGYNIYTEQTLVITGSATLTSGKGGISAANFTGKATLTIYADLDIDAKTTGIMGFGPDIYINGGNINIKTAENSVGIMGYNKNIIINGGNINITGTPMLGIFGITNLEISDASINVTGSQAAVAMNYDTSTIDIVSPTTILEPAGAKTGIIKLPGNNGEPTDTAGIANADGTNATSVKIGLNPDIAIKTVTFDLQGHGLPISPKNVESGTPVREPAEPQAPNYTFKGWYKDAGCTDKYDFSTPVTENITLYAKWEASQTINDISGSGSPLDPMPTIIPGETMDLYLVKGQKFNIGEGWSVDKGGSKIVSISKKGAFKAKKAGDTTISSQSGDTTYTINVHVAAPKMVEKSKKLEIRSADNIAYTDITLGFIDKDKYDIFWYSASPDVATVDQNGKVTAVSQGKAKVTAYVNGNAYTCTVSVKEITAAANRTFHLALGTSKSLSIKGIKKPVWNASPEGIVSFKGKKKISGDAAGSTILTTTADEKTYTVETYVENLALTDSDNRLTSDKGANKYKLSMDNGGTTKIQLDASVHQDVVFKSSKANIAFIDENGTVYARSKGKCKLTAKIDGKTITINVEVK